MRSSVHLQTVLLVVTVAAGCHNGEAAKADTGRSPSGSDGGGISDVASPTADTGSGRACPTVSACGGTIEPGTFSISSFCAAPAPRAYTLVCETAMLTTTITDAQGTFTFSDDGTYASSIVSTPHMLLTVPASCMAKPGGVRTCGELGTRLQNFGSEPSPAPVTCTGDSDCSCTITGTTSTDARGYWAKDGNTLLLTPAGKSSASPVPYCVSGNQITLAPNLTGGGQETMVLARQ